MSLRSIQLASFLLALSASAALAQTHFCIAGELDHLQPAEVAACQAKMTGIREAVRHHGAPEGWHVVVVCDEAGWRDYAAIAGNSATLRTASFHSDSAAGYTFVRASGMGEGYSEALRVVAASVPARKEGLDELPTVKRTLPRPSLSVAQVSLPDGDNTAAQVTPGE